VTRREKSGSSPSNRSAVLSPRFASCRSRQLTETFSSPSSYQRMRKSSGSKETSLMRVGKRYQAMRPATFAQKPSGSRTEAS
jgi:bisphosphoglycerate-independent phosphoglycerate mutase (AlkP superfamily)